MIINAPATAPWEIEIEINSKEDLACIDEIDCKSIKGVFLNFHKRLSLRFVSRFEKLQFLMISGNTRDFSYISACTELKELYLVDTKIDSFDFIENTKINSLTLERVQSKANFLRFPQLPNLETLSVSQMSQVKNLDFLDACQNLKRLYLLHLPIKAIHDFSEFSQLTQLTVRNCDDLKDLKNLATAKNLEKLILTSIQLNRTDLRTIKKLKQMGDLRLVDIDFQTRTESTLQEALNDLKMRAMVL